MGTESWHILGTLGFWGFEEGRRKRLETGGSRSVQAGRNPRFNQARKDGGGKVIQTTGWSEIIEIRLNVN